VKLDLRKLIAIDIESSGPDPFRNELLSVALVPFDESIRPLSIFIDYGEITWSETAQSFFENYRQEWEQSKIPPNAARAKIESFFRNLPEAEYTLVGHNVGFDFSFLKKLFSSTGSVSISKLSHRSLDTHTLLYLLRIMGHLPDAALQSSGAFDHFGIHVDERVRHTALADAIATRQLFLNILRGFSIRA
jgi:DNA polymerase III epsilon subunit-like protein